MRKYGWVVLLVTVLGAGTASAQLVISEFRLRGRNGSGDEFIEIQNATNGPVTVASPTGSGYAIAASDFSVRCMIPNGTVFPPLPNGGSAVVEFSGNTEIVPPAVVSITRLDPSPTTLMAVRFLVTFSEPVTGVDASDFALVTAIPGAAITGVTGGGTSWTVTVSTSAGNGTIRLDLIDDDSIVDADPTPLGGPGAGNGNFTTGEVYTIGAVNVPALDPRLLVLLAVVLAVLAARHSA